MGQKAGACPKEGLLTHPRFPLTNLPRDSVGYRISDPISLSSPQRVRIIYIKGLIWP